MRETQILNQQQEIKQKLANEQEQAKQQQKKRRWDQSAPENNKPRDDMPTPQNFAETPAQRMIWEATPGPVSPSHETPGHEHETPGRAVSQSARRRWDETPRTERETLDSSGWAETPKAERLEDTMMMKSAAAAAAASAAAAKKRSRWDETPVGGSSQQTPQMMTPSTVIGTPSYPDFTPSGTTPSGMKAMNLATPMASQIPMTPEQMQAYRWEREIDERNRPFTDDDLDTMFPPGYRVS
jgi:splicing factor 3B subunit 1